MSAPTLEPLVSNQEFPIFWLGGRFDGMALTGVDSDPSGAYDIQYGTCTVGGPETCVSPLAVISSPDNSFLPDAGAVNGTTSIRGVRAVLASDGKVIEIATGPDMVDIHAKSAALARFAADRMVAINELGTPGAALPAGQGNTGFAAKPLEGQLPQTVQGMPALRQGGR
ncbi:MAG: hypothetical protein WAU69_00425 [Solirubrobacteraceae bacterium]